jgi:Xaa-Pro aminopeptidase
VYLPDEGLGVRIEDTVVVTATGYEVLSTGLPRTVAEIEAWLAERRKRGDSRQ